MVIIKCNASSSRESFDPALAGVCWPNISRENSLLVASHYLLALF
jgi:hypothetical protein